MGQARGSGSAGPIIALSSWSNVVVLPEGEAVSTGLGVVHPFPQTSIPFLLQLPPHRSLMTRFHHCSGKIHADFRWVEDP